MEGTWIWYAPKSPTENTAGCFAQRFVVEDMAQPVCLDISADTRYVLYLNGRELGRGPIRSRIERWYYDSYNLSPFLQKGENFLAVRVWDYGWSTLQSIASQGGVIYSITQNGEVIAASGSGTKSQQDKGLRYNTVKRNVNLGFMEHYDGQQGCLDWVRNPTLSDDWDNAMAVEDIWGELSPRPIRHYHTEKRFPQQVVQAGEASSGCLQISVNTRTAFFPHRRDANETILSGFLGVVIETPENMKGHICFPNRTWNGLMGDFSVGGRVYPVSNAERDIEVSLKKGRQLFLMQISGKYDDLFCHMEWSFPQYLALRSPYGDEAAPFFVIGPTQQIASSADGRSTVYGGLEEFNRIALHTARHEAIFACGSAEELTALGEELRPVPQEYTFYDTYLLSLARRDRCLERPVTSNLSAVLWDNAETVVLPVPQEGQFQQILLDMGDLYVGALEITLRANKGTVVDFYGFENMFQGQIDYTIGLNNGMRYICDDGWQSYTSLSRLGFRYLLITLRNQTGLVELQQVGLLHSTYAPSGQGSFRCSDPLLNDIWEMSKHTHLTCMEDGFVDSPVWEQAFWVGDALISAFTNTYLYGEYELMRHVLHLAVTAKDNTPLFNALTPTDWDASIPMWTMNWVLAIQQYMEDSGDQSVLTQLYAPLAEMLHYYASFVEEDGGFLVNAWNMLDWAALDIHNHGVVSGQQAILAHCFRLGAGYAVQMGQGDDAAYFEQVQQRLLAYLDTKVWDDDKQMFLDGWSPEHGLSQTVSIQTHSLLLLFDAISDPAKKAIVEQYIAKPPLEFLEVGSPFILFYLYELWAKKRTQQMLDDIKTRWGAMLRYDSTTCWEVFPGFYENSRTRSYCHSWSSSPVYFLGKYLLGVHNEGQGFSTVEIHLPDVDLDWCDGSVPTPHGVIRVHWEKENGQKRYCISHPQAIQVRIVSSDGWQVECVPIGADR